MAQHRTDDHPGAVRRDDALMDLLGDPEYMPGQGELARALAAQRRAVHAGPDRDLIDTDAALAAMQGGRPFAPDVTLLVVVMMIGTTLGAVMAYLVTDFVSAALAAVALPAICVLLAAGVVAYLERRR